MASEGMIPFRRRNGGWSRSVVSRSLDAHWAIGASESKAEGIGRPQVEERGREWTIQPSATWQWSRRKGTQVVNE